ncbi:MAG: cellulase family glycosylhydrolase, partial [Syntrophothermus sp.]
MKNKFTILTAILIFLTAGKISSQDFLKVSGTRIVNSKGEEIILRGMGLGGWMLQEGYMLKINGQGMQHLIKARITDLIGRDKCDQFYAQWHMNHMRKADVDSLAKWGFNSIRLPMHYNLYTLPIEEEPVKGENTWLSKGFKMTDSLLSWCRANKIMLILDLHAAPGGQGKDANISDYDTTKPSIWENELNKQKTIAFWRKLAERYANDPYIGGYDLLNEPNWTFEGKNRNGLDDSQNGPIWDLYKEITAAIRQVDTNHLIIIEGNGWGNNYRGFPGPWDNNMVFSFHKYWNANNQQDISGILALRDKYQIPIWLGESGENSDKWFTDCISLVEKNGIGWSWWPLKKIGSVICPLMIKVPDGYDSVVDYWNGKGERPSKEAAERALFEAAENLKAENCRFNKDIIDAMFRQVNNKSAKPFAINTVPGRVYASDYDLGYSGEAYNDRESERTGEPDKRAGNKG